MVICLLDPNFLKKEHSGTTTYNFYLARGLASFGHQVHIIADDGPEKNKIISKNVKIHCIKSKSKTVAGNKKTWDFFGLKTFMYLTYSLLRRSSIYFREYRKLNKISPIDVVECSDDLFSFWFVIFCSKKVVIRIHGPWSLIWKLNKKHFGLASKAVYFLEKIQFLRAKHLTTPSEFMERKINDYYRIVKKISVIKNPIEMKFLKKHFKPSDSYLLYLGRLEFNKGILQIIEVAKNNDNQIVIAGGKDDGFDQKLYEQILKQKNINYLGPLEYNALLKKIAGAELVLAPSRFENCPYAVLESLALKKIILATDNKGIRAIITDNKNGFICRGNYSLCIKSILRLNLDHKKLIQKSAEMSAARYDIKNVIPEVLRFYKDVIKN